MFLPRTSPWKKAFVGTLVVLPLSLTVFTVLALRYFYKQRRFQGMNQGLELFLLHNETVQVGGLTGFIFPAS